MGSVHRDGSRMCMMTTEKGGELTNEAMSGNAPPTVHNRAANDGEQNHGVSCPLVTGYERLSELSIARCNLHGARKTKICRFYDVTKSHPGFNDKQNLTPRKKTLRGIKRRVVGVY